MLSLFRKAAEAASLYSIDDVVAMLGLIPHPEGGYYREMFRDSHEIDGKRSASSAIYYLLTAETPLGWHRIDATEIWHWYAGAPIILSIADGKELNRSRIGANLMQGERPQAVVPANLWQALQTSGEWTLLGCTVAPAFEMSAMEMAPAGWQPE